MRAVLEPEYPPAHARAAEETRKIWAEVGDGLLEYTCGATWGRENAMALTVREALTIAEPLRRAKVVAGEQGLDNVIQSVNVMEVPNILDWVHPGELLVTTRYPPATTRRRRGQ